MKFTEENVNLWFSLPSFVNFVLTERKSNIEFLGSIKNQIEKIERQLKFFVGFYEFKESRFFGRSDFRDETFEMNRTISRELSLLKNDVFQFVEIFFRRQMFQTLKNEFEQNILQRLPSRIDRRLSIGIVQRDRTIRRTLKTSFSPFEIARY